jgi:hypothetical protein
MILIKCTFIRLGLKRHGALWSGIQAESFPLEGRSPPSPKAMSRQSDSHQQKKKSVQRWKFGFNDARASPRTKGAEVSIN